MNVDIGIPKGYRTRTCFGPEDLPRLAGLLNASEAANGALQLYEGCGFRSYRRSVTLRRDLVLKPATQESA